MRRGSNSLPDGTISLTMACPEYWISSLIEYSLEGNCVLATGPPPPIALASDRLLDPSWRAGLMHSELKYLHREGMHSHQVLLTLDASYSCSLWKNTPVLPSWLTNTSSPCPPGRWASVARSNLRTSPGVARNHVLHCIHAASLDSWRGTHH